MPSFSRREFVRSAAVAVAAGPSWLAGAASTTRMDLKECVLVGSENPTARERKALAVLAEEARKRSGLSWSLKAGGNETSAVTIHVGIASGLRIKGASPDPGQGRE